MRTNYSAARNTSLRPSAPSNATKKFLKSSSSPKKWCNWRARRLCTIYTGITSYIRPLWPKLTVQCVMESCWPPYSVWRSKCWRRTTWSSICPFVNSYSSSTCTCPQKSTAYRCKNSRSSRYKNTTSIRSRQRQRNSPDKQLQRALPHRLKRIPILLSTALAHPTKQWQAVPRLPITPIATWRVRRRRLRLRHRRLSLMK